MKATSDLKGLREARTSAGLTQAEVGRACGVSAQAASQWEVGSTVPAGPARILLAQLFGVPVEAVDSWFERREAA
jgi:transcriptional regulator with XRE-family HTH domain